MDRRPLMVSTAAGIAILVLVIAASSAPVDVWVTPPTEVTTPSVVAAPTDVFIPPAARNSGSDSWPAWATTAMKILSIVSLSLFVLLVLAAGRAGPWSMFERVLGRIRRRPPATPLAQVADRVDLVDVEAAARHLSRGTPRNAIVACWMQLEADAGVAGLARADAETSAEYVARVVASASVDTAPIGELAALYREARFSRHDLDERHRTRAVAALLDVKSALANSPAVTA